MLHTCGRERQPPTPTPTPTPPHRQGSQRATLALANLGPSLPSAGAWTLRGGPDTPRRASCWALPDKVRRTERGSPGALLLPGAPLATYLSRPSLSSCCPGWKAQPGAGRLPAQPAPALSRTLGQMWGGLSRAIGLGRCFRLISRISPGSAATLWARKRGSGRAPHLSHHPHFPPVPQVPLFPPLEPRF